MLSTLLLLSLAGYHDVVSSTVSIGLQALGALVVLLYAAIHRRNIRTPVLRLILRYRRWMYYPRNNSTRIFLGLVRMLSGEHPRLLDLQAALPSLPVPPLARIARNHLEAVRPVVSERDYAASTAAVELFLAGDGVRLHRRLLERAVVANTCTPRTTWMRDWWTREVFLSTRSPLPVFSNWYCCDMIPSRAVSPVARAAGLIAGLARMHLRLATGDMAPNRLNYVPLCMMAYNRVFGTVRVPGETCDAIITHRGSLHVVVMVGSHCFSLRVIKADGSPISATEAYNQLQVAMRMIAAVRCGWVAVGGRGETQGQCGVWSFASLVSG